MRTLLAALAVVTLTLSGGCWPKPESDSSSSTPSTETRRPLSDGDPLTGTLRAGEDTKMKIDKIAIQKAIDGFREAEGHPPASLQELVDKKYLSMMPREPVGWQFQYDPRTGNFDMVPKMVPANPPAQ
ncbi:MAG: hypothetical protein JO317_04250 [Verrucomicrobiae bacterium]|nr:hypothetical protein [Verrucomicrobiae bacterium]